MNYLLDSDTFISAKNRHYGFDICPAFWDWIDQETKSGQVGSITEVCKELQSGNDDLAKWAAQRKAAIWFLDISDQPTQMIYRALVAQISSASYPSSAIAQFLKGADPWLIAKAKIVGATVVTHEVHDPRAKRRVPLPTAALAHGVQCIDVFELLRKSSAKFRL